MNQLITTRKKLISMDGTQKFLFELSDRNLIESVLMQQDFGCSLCVTTQVGCNMGCDFCASGLIKKERNLSAEEILLQVIEAQKSTGNPITHVVLMGTGEPFDNYEEVIRFCDIISDEKLLISSAYSLFPDLHFVKDLKEAQGHFNLSYKSAADLCPTNLEEASQNYPSLKKEYFISAVAPRHITVSTCGLVPKIYDFINTKKRYNLAISLHAPNDVLRNQLMPVNRKYPLSELMSAVSVYCKSTGRRVTFEYILLDGINDSDKCAMELSLLLKNVDAYVNLIPFNSVNEFSYKGASKEKALHFYDILMKNKIRTTLRKERGSDISAACGQLRAEAVKG